LKTIQWLSKLFILLLSFEGFSQAEVRILEAPEFGFSAKASDIKSPLLPLLKPAAKDIYVSFDIEIQVAKSFDSIRDEDFQNKEMIKALVGVHDIKQIAGDKGMSWNVTKTAKKMGVSLDVKLKIEQLLVRSTTPRGSQAIAAWFALKHKNNSFPLRVQDDELLIIQTLSEFDRMFSQGVNILRIRKQNADFVSVKVQSLVILQKAAFNKLQAATLFNTRGTLEKALMEQLDLSIETLPKIW
jgi:hypothetical protein